MTDSAERLQRMTEIEAEEVMLGRVSYQEASTPAQLIADRYFNSRPPEVRAQAEAAAAVSRAGKQAALEAAAEADRQAEAERWAQSDPDREMEIS